MNMALIWTQDEKYPVYQSGDANHSDIWVVPMQTGLLRRPGKPIRLTNGPLPYSLPVPSRDGKQIFVLGTKQRGELVRYDMKSQPVRAVPLRDFGHRCNILQGWKMGRLRFLSGPHFMAQPQRWNGTYAADLPSDGGGFPIHFAGRNASCV